MFRLFNKKFKEEELRPTTIQELVEAYNFHNYHMIKILNTILDKEFGGEYSIAQISAVHQINNLKQALYINQDIAINNENYMMAAKFRDDIERVKKLMKTIQNSKIK